MRGSGGAIGSDGGTDPIGDSGREPLPDDAVVVRGGMMASQFLFEAVQDHTDDFPGELALSVASVPGLTADEIAEVAWFVNQGKMRATTAGNLKAAGYGAEVDGEPHALVILPREPDEQMWEELRQVFGDLRPNPYPGTGPPESEGLKQ